MNHLTVACPAKINLSLRVFPRRDDGYHDIESLVALVGLYDDLTIEPRKDGRLTIECDDPSIPVDDSNLAMRAADALDRACGRGRGAHLRLSKRIPAGSGLGGGSSNAAAALVGLNRLWGLERSTAELARLAASIGSDVPLFLHPSPCIVRGRGELVEPVALPLPRWCVLILPLIHCSTRDVYAEFDRQHAGARSSPIVEPGPAAHAAEAGHNDLLPAALAISPPLRSHYDRLSEADPGGVRLTGSGSGLFRLFDDRAAATAFAQRVKRMGDASVAIVPTTAAITVRGRRRAARRTDVGAAAVDAAVRQSGGVRPR